MIRRTAEAALVLAATLVAGWLFDGYFYGTGHRSYLLAAASLGAVTAFLGVAGRSPWLRVPAILLALAGPCGLFLVLFRPGPSGGVVAALGQGLAGVHLGWSRMMTVGLPAAATPDLLVLPVVTMWICALAGVWLLVRPGARLLPMAPPAAAYLIALLLTASRTSTRWVPTALLLACAVLLVLLRQGGGAGAPAARPGPGRPAGPGTGRPGGPAPARQGRLALVSAARRGPGALVAGAVVLALVAGAGVGGAMLVPAGATRPPYDPRSSITPPEESVEVSNPLHGLKEQLTAPRARSLFTIKVTAPQLARGLTRVRVAALDAYNGANWEPTGQFLRPGARIPQDGVVRQSVPAVLAVELADYTGTFLPVAGMPTAVEGDGLRAAVPQGNVITTAPGTAGFRYTVHTQVGSVDPVGVQSAVPDLSQGTAYTALPDGSAALCRRAHEMTKGQGTPYAQLKALEDALRKLPYGTVGSPGEAYAQLNDMLSAHPVWYPDSFAEQRASAFAVLARCLGFPTRVDAGYVLSASRRQPDGSYRITTDDAHAWPEVRLVGYGWVAFEPTDPSMIARDRPRDDQPPQVTPQAGHDPKVDAQVNPEAATAPGAGVGGGESPWRWLWLLLLLPLLTPLFVVLAKAARRRRRRGAPTTRGRVLGAWAEARDRLQEAGLPRDLALTPPEMVRRAEKAFGAPVTAALRTLGPLVDAAACSPFDPAAGDVDRAWAGYARLAKAVGRAGSPLGRLRRPFDPRPLFVRRQDGGAGAPAQEAAESPQRPNGPQGPPPPGAGYVQGVLVRATAPPSAGSLARSGAGSMLDASPFGGWPR